MSKPSKRAGAPVWINLAQNVIDAGEEAFRECEDDQISSSALVEEVFRAMVRALPAASTGGFRLRVCPGKAKTFED